MIDWFFSFEGLCLLWLTFFIYCVFGWIIESIYCSVLERRIINRGFLNGPYIPIYGSGALIAVLFLSKLPALLPADIQGLLGSFAGPLTLFLAGGTASCILEYVTSYVMEKIYHARWWDYSHLPLNLNGRIWAGGFVEFGIGCALVVYVVHPPLKDAILLIPRLAVYIASAITFAAFVTDLIVTHVGITNLRSRMDELKAGTLERLENMRSLAGRLPEAAEVSDWDSVVFAQLKHYLKHARGRLRDMSPDVSLPSVSLPSLPALPHTHLPSLEDFVASFSERLSTQERRLMKAFPHMRPTNYRQNLEDFSRRWLEEVAEHTMQSRSKDEKSENDSTKPRD